MSAIYKRNITVVGIGMGNENTITIEAAEKIKGADIVFGAGRILELAKRYNCSTEELYLSEDIADYLNMHTEYKNAVLAVSGDTGFYSAAKKAFERLKGYNVQFVSGITSAAYFCARINKSWEKMRLLSSHGRNANLIDEIRRNREVFSIMSGKDGINRFLKDLIYYDFSDITVWIGERLSYNDERITKGTPLELLNNEFLEPVCIIAENNNHNSFVKVSDEDFIRGKVPMTKDEIRTVSIQKLGLKSDSVIYDIGAGTGAVSIEMALNAYEGRVYAVEKNPEGIELINANKIKFKVSNIEPVYGEASEMIDSLPIPTHAFIGGSSRKLEEIVEKLLDKNKGIKIVINAITLETLSSVLTLLEKHNIKNSDIVQLMVSKAKKISSYNMMQADNPIYIISFCGDKESKDYE